MKTAGFIAAIAVAATAVTAGVALADGHGKGKHGARHSFEDLDLDGNGEVTMEEMIQHREARFKAADTDGDGFLSKEELTAKAQKKAEGKADKMMKRFDANNDGKLALDEMPKPRKSEKMFEKLDADGSGGVSKAEFEAAREKMKKKHGGQGKQGGQGTQSN